MTDASISVAEDRLVRSLVPETELRSGSLPQSIPTQEQITSPPPHPGNSRPRRSNRKEVSGAGWMIFMGIVLPIITIGFEFLTHACAEDLFDPIPSWLHVLLLLLVPAGNLLVLKSLEWSRSDRLDWLAPLQAAVLVICSAYTLLLAPFMPFALFGVLFCGIGLIPMSPALALIASSMGLFKLRKLAHEEGRKLPRIWPAMLATLALLAWAPLQGLFTNWAISLTTSSDQTASQRGLWWLRTFGSEHQLLRSCYPGTARNWLEWPPKVVAKAPDAVAATEEISRKVYYRVTGHPFNSVPAPAGKGLGANGVGRWNLDTGLGGTQVANRVPGLSMISSRLDGKTDVSAGSSYLEWTMVFKNIAANQSEARAQIELPPGAAVSRLTLWINGEPQEAAFGGRSQVRAAYQEVAVMQRRDPVLVTTSGPNRVLMQCFPVPPNGGEMKVRVGITAPLKIVNGTRSEVLLPRMLEWNFEQASSLRHELWLESDQPLAIAGNPSGQTLRHRLSDSDLLEGPRITAEHTAADEIWTEDPTDPTFAIRQVIRQRRVKAPGRVIVLVDGSRSMRPHLRALSDSLNQLPPDTEFSIVFAGDEVEKPWESVRRATSEELKTATAWLANRKMTGGRENLQALLDAWDLAAAIPGSAILWVHGSQPVLLNTAEPLLQRRERDRTPPIIYDVAVEPGPNRILEQLDGFDGLRPLRSGTNPVENIGELLSLWSGKTTEWYAERQRVPRPENFAGLPRTDRHLARLWGAEEVDRLRLAPEQGSLEQAMKLALELKLVTPVSGAVVLERADQYARHGLKPGDPSESPTVPEPTTGALLVIAAGGFAGLRRWRKESATASHLTRQGLHSAASAFPKVDVQ